MRKSTDIAQLFDTLTGYYEESKKLNIHIAHIEELIQIFNVMNTIERLEPIMHLYDENTRMEACPNCIIKSYTSASEKMEVITKHMSISDKTLSFIRTIMGEAENLAAKRVCPTVNVMHQFSRIFEVMHRKDMLLKEKEFIRSNDLEIPTELINEIDYSEKRIHSLIRALI